MLERGQLYSNPERKVKHWQSDVIRRGRANLFHEVPRHHFGEKQGGWTHAVAEDALMLDYERR